MHSQIIGRHGRPEAGTSFGWRSGLVAHRRGLLVLASLIPLLTLASGQARAEPTSRDLQLVARVLGFLEQPPTGLVDVGIVYPEGSTEGRAEAGRLAALFNDGIRAGGVTLRPRPLAIEDVPTTGLRVVLLTDSAVRQAAALARKVATREVLTVTFSQPVVDEGLVVLAVRSQPRVEILVSRAAARSAGIGFAGAFRMMIQER